MYGVLFGEWIVYSRPLIGKPVIYDIEWAGEALLNENTLQLRWPYEWKTLKSKGELSDTFSERRPQLDPKSPDSVQNLSLVTRTVT